MSPKVVLVAAMDRNRAIGKQGDLPWRLRDDLKAFKALTSGSPVIMGRKTWDSIGRPLPGRQNIVMTRNPDMNLEAVTVVSSPEQALNMADSDAETVYVIGGGAIYHTFLPLADQLVLTRVDAAVEGADAWFPEWEPEKYTHLSSTAYPADDRNEFPFVIESYGKIHSNC